MPPVECLQTFIESKNEPLTLIRNGVIVGAGRVGSITAASVHRAGDDRMVVF